MDRRRRRQTVVHGYRPSSADDELSSGDDESSYGDGRDDKDSRDPERRLSLWPLVSFGSLQRCYASRKYRTEPPTSTSVPGGAGSSSPPRPVTAAAGRGSTAR